MTTDLAAPPQTRPPHISPQWWYRATWHARKQVVDAHNRTMRPIDNTIDRDERPLPTTLDGDTIIEFATQLLDEGETPHNIAARLGTTVSALEQRFRRRGLKHLAKPFLQARKAEKIHPCMDCGKPVTERAKRCSPCGAIETGNRPEVREFRSANARRMNELNKVRAA